MPGPGSTFALVLPGATQVSDEPEKPAKRVAPMLREFLDPKQFTALAVVHGQSKSALKAFDLAKQRHARKRGLVWIPDAALIDGLADADAATMKKVFKPVDGFLMTFVSVKARRVTGKLAWSRLNLAEIDERYLEAGLAL